MATIQKSTQGRGDSAELVFVDLTGTDDFLFNPSANETLIMVNTTGSDVTVTIDGDGSTSENCPGIGDIDVSGGKALVIDANDTETIQLSSISAYLSGTIAVTGGTGISAAILVV